MLKRNYLLIGTILGLSLGVPAIAYAGCTLFQHRDYRGSSWHMDSGEGLRMVKGEDIGTTTNGHGGEDTLIRSNASWNDAVSSFKVDRGCQITLWQHVDKRGARFRTHKSYSYIGGDWNDKASAAMCTC